MLVEEKTIHASNFVGVYEDLTSNGNSYETKSLENLKEIASILNKKGTQKPIIQIGAGLSKDYNLPNWNQLILKILGDENCLNFTGENNIFTIDKEFEKLLDCLSPDQWISFAGKIIEQNHDKLENVIKKNLYPKNIDFESKSLLLEIVNKWILEKKISGVITYNFDNILEQILSFKMHPTKVFFDNNYKEIDSNSLFNDNLLNIYHVHGYVPLNGDNTQVVMGEKSYFDQYSNPLNWQNIILLNSLLHHNNIFLGISMADANMRRVLSQARLLGGKKHYLITKKDVIFKEDSLVDIEKTNVVNEIKSQYFETLNLGLIFLENYELSSYANLFS